MPIEGSTLTYAVEYEHGSDTPDLMRTLFEGTTLASTWQFAPAPTEPDAFIAWLDSEDFGTDPDRVRREAWRG